MVDERPTESDDTPAAAPGRVRRDAQGNAVWEWNTDGVGTTSRLLRKLDVPGLGIVEEGKPAEGAEAAKPRRVREQGFDPYGTHGATPAPRAQRVKPPREPVRKPSLLARLFGRR
jgi:hypothetical protein